MLVYALFSFHSDSLHVAKDTSQVAELEQHIYGMTDTGRGVTKEGPTYHILLYIAISFVQFIPIYVGLAQAHPSNYAQLVYSNYV